MHVCATAGVPRIDLFGESFESCIAKRKQSTPGVMRCEACQPIRLIDVCKCASALGSGAHNLGSAAPKQLDRTR